MKKIFKYMIVGLVACTTLSSCLESSLDTNPTDSMSGSGLLANANAALVSTERSLPFHVFSMVSNR